MSYKPFFGSPKPRLGATGTVEYVAMLNSPELYFDPPDNKRCQREDHQWLTNKEVGIGSPVYNRAQAGQQCPGLWWECQTCGAIRGQLPKNEGKMKYRGIEGPLV